MKTLLYLTISFSFLFAGCSSKYTEVENTNNEEAIETTDATDESNRNKEDEKLFASDDCDQIIKDYEEFMDAYIGVMNEFMNNPGSTEAAERYTTMMDEKIDWDQNFMQKFMTCAQNKRYAKRIEKLSKKYEEAMEEFSE